MANKNPPLRIEIYQSGKYYRLRLIHANGKVANDQYTRKRDAERARAALIKSISEMAKIETARPIR